MNTTAYDGSISARGFDLNEDAGSSSGNNDYYGDISSTPVNTCGYRDGLSNSAHTLYGHGRTDVVTVGTQFDSVEEVEAWYKKHAKIVGFSIRKDVLRRDNKSGKTASRTWVCSGQGYRLQKWLHRTDRVREPRGITRNGCRASFRVGFEPSTNKYVVTKFVDEHSHALVAAYETQFLRSHRHVNDADFGHAKALREVGVKVCQFMDYKSDQVGGFHNVGFMAKDLQNKIYKSPHADLLESDSEAAIAYLAAKADSDLGVYYQYTLDASNRLRHLFWTDSVARYDYECFGDVLAFDATYKKNAYNMPLVALVGTNHHRRTTVFSFALLSDETVESYTWLLQTFLTVMQNKMPKSIITDGDKAMSKAIKTTMPGIPHRLCCWHLERNAIANIKTQAFTIKFRNLMLNPISIDEFERQWFALVSELGLEQNGWVQKMYEKRGKWAEAYLKGTFFGAMRSTQRCESLNSYLSRFVQFKLKLYDFIRQIFRALYSIRHREGKDEFESNHSSPVLTTHLHSIEKHASEVYTKNVFQWVRSEIYKEASLIMIDCVNSIESKVYTISKFQHPELKWTVGYEVEGDQLLCSCRMVESAGIPCRHIFHVMKLEQMVHIPPTLIVSRWTISAKIPSQTQVYISAPHIDKELAEIVKFGSLTSACNHMCIVASKNNNAYSEALQEIKQLTTRFQEMVADDESEQRGKSTARERGIKLKDPMLVHTKGFAKTKKSEKGKCRKCSYFQQIGHTKRTCPLVRSENDDDKSGGHSMGVGCSYGHTLQVSGSTPTYCVPSTQQAWTGFTFETNHPSMHGKSEESVGGNDSNNVAAASQSFPTTYSSWWPHCNL